MLLDIQEYESFTFGIKIYPKNTTVYASQNVWIIQKIFDLNFCGTNFFLSNYLWERWWRTCDDQPDGKIYSLVKLDYNHILSCFYFLISLLIPHVWSLSKLQFYTIQQWGRLPIKSLGNITIYIRYHTCTSPQPLKFFRK